MSDMSERGANMTHVLPSHLGSCKPCKNNHNQFIIRAANSIHRHAGMCTEAMDSHFEKLFLVKQQNFMQVLFLDMLTSTIKN
jgi:hypothetical protein